MTAVAATRRSRTNPSPAHVKRVARVRAGTRPGWVLPALLIAAAASFAYGTSFRGVFALDDVRAIVRNETIRTVWPLSVPLHPPAASTVAGRPVANLSFALNLALAPGSSEPSSGGTGSRAATGGRALDPAPFHAGNLIIHVLAALALYGVIRRTLAAPPLAPDFEGAAPWIALAAALAWVAHPLTTAAVTYLVQRVESLMALFYLLTLYAAIRAFSGRRTGWWTAAAIASCALGMATKEVMVSAPIVVAAWWWLFAPARPDGRRRDGRPLLAGLAATWVVLAFLVAGERRGPSIDLAWSAVWPYLLAQAEIVVHYVRLSLVPSPLVFFYDWPLGTSLGAVAWQAALLTSLVALTVIGVARRRPASFLGVCFFLVLAPSSSVLPIVTEVAAEHRMYLPLAAIVTAVVLGVFLAGRRLLPSPKIGAGAAAMLALAVVAALGAETRDRNRVYWSAERLWQDTVTKRPGDARSRVAYGDVLAAAGRLPEAEAQLRAGIALAPDDPAARVRLGAVLAQQQRFDDAVPQLERALALRPGDVDARRFLGEIYAVRRQDALAVSEYEQALASLPGDAQLMGRLAALLADSRDPQVRNATRAKELAGEAVRLSGGRDPRLIEILSAAQAAIGAFAEAAATARTAAAVARAGGDAALVSALEYRAAAYEKAAREPFGPSR
jgi:protein O-mannosyl-transferase